MLTSGAWMFHFHYPEAQNPPDPTGILACDPKAILIEGIGRVPAPFNYDLRLQFVDMEGVSEAEVLDVLTPIPIAELNYWELEWFCAMMTSDRRRYPDTPQWETWEGSAKECMKNALFIEGQTVARSFSVKAPGQSRVTPMWERLEAATSGPMRSSIPSRGGTACQAGLDGPVALHSFIFTAAS